MRILPLLLLITAGCGVRRSYPLIRVDSEPDATRGMQIRAAAALPDDEVVIASRYDTETLWRMGQPDTHGARRLSPSDLMAFDDPSAACDELEPAKAKRCRERNYRALVRMTPQPIRWLPPLPPGTIEDLTPFPCRAREPDVEASEAPAPCTPAVLGVSTFDTIHITTPFHDEEVDIERAQHERLFLLEQEQGVWRERSSPLISRIQDELSDWGRAHCPDRFTVSGIAHRPDPGVLYIGVSACDGPAAKVLSYDLAAARRGEVVHFEPFLDDIVDARGLSDRGPDERLSSLDYRHDRLWGTSAWQSFGHEHETAFGGRLLIRRDDAFTAIDVPSGLADRPYALVVLDTPGRASSMDESTDGAALPDVEAVSHLLFFDNGRSSGSEERPQLTVLRTRVPAPPEGSFLDLLEVNANPSMPLLLNGFDFEWYLRDHRLGAWTFLLGAHEERPGGWTTALGGLWQVRLGLIGRKTRAFLGKALGHNRQAVEVTDIRGTGLDVSSVELTLTVQPQPVQSSTPSVAELLRTPDPRFDLLVPRPEGMAGTPVLQGLTIDTASHASGGICLSAMDLGVYDAGPEHPDHLRVRARLNGGLCNDFNNRDKDEHHGIITDPSQGIRVRLSVALVDGRAPRAVSVRASQRDLIGRRDGPTHVITEEQVVRVPRAPYRDVPGAIETNNKVHKTNFACIAVDASGAPRLLPRAIGPDPDDTEWMVRTEGTPPPHDRVSLGVQGFAFAFDLRGFDPGLWPAAYGDVSELSARSQNNYLYRYLLRTWPMPQGGLFLEGGVSHGVHLKGLGRDNASPTALMVRSDAVWWDAPGIPWVAPDPAQRRTDPNLLPEDGYLRWAVTEPMDEEGPRCRDH